MQTYAKNLQKKTTNTLCMKEKKNKKKLGGKIGQYDLLWCSSDLQGGLYGLNCLVANKIWPPLKMSKKFLSAKFCLLSG